MARVAASETVEETARVPPAPATEIPATAPGDPEAVTVREEILTQMAAMAPTETGPVTMTQAPPVPGGTETEKVPAIFPYQTAACWII